MAELDPSATTAQDIVTAALHDANVVGVGQTPLAEDLVAGQARLQWLLEQWERKRWLVWGLTTIGCLSTGQQVYTIGPGGDFDTNQDPQTFAGTTNPQVSGTPFAPAFGGPGPGTLPNPATQTTAGPWQPGIQQPFGPAAPPVSVRPDKIESSFLRQLVLSQPNYIDYPMTIITSWEAYNRIALKQLVSFPGYLFYDTAWPLGNLYPWPVPQASIYELFVTIKNQLPPAFATSNAKFNIPYEYYRAMVKNLALELRTRYGINTFPGDSLPGQAKDSLRAVRGANTQIATLVMPGDLVRPQLYNIFSDRNY